VSPMPFGDRTEPHLELGYDDVGCVMTSPMPFGDRTEPHAERRRYEAGRCDCLQCLSAIGLNLTMKMEPKRHEGEIGLQCLSAIGLNLTWWIKGELIMKVSSSPMPFGDRTEPHSRGAMSAAAVGMWSPMPFGDRTEPHGGRSCGVQGRRRGLQCLSAIGLNLTAPPAEEGRSTGRESPMPFGDRTEPHISRA